eukprot:11163940-Karenia_brevis.AAC.1
MASWGERGNVGQHWMPHNMGWAYNHNNNRNNNHNNYYKPSWGRTQPHHQNRPQQQYQHKPLPSGLNQWASTHCG